MRLQTFALAALAAAFVAPAAHAQDQGITYDCDTAADHYSELVLPTPGTRFTVTGSVRLMTSAASKDYVALTRLSVGPAADQPGPSDAGWAGFELLVVPPKSKKDAPVPVVATSAKAKGGENKIDLVGKVASGEDIAFSLGYDGAQVSMTLGDEQRKLAFATDRPVVRLVCSTGEFLYTKLVVKPGN